MKHAAQVVIFNDKGEVLCVSRKDDHTSFGLPGGKVDPEDSSPISGAIRETLEETGLHIIMKDLIEIFSMHRNGYMGHTYLVCRKYNDTEFNHNEPHVVKWGSFKDLREGTFGPWNTLVQESLISMGHNFKID